MIKRSSGLETEVNQEIVKNKCVDLEYLNQRTKSHPRLMMEMISAYLEQTPPLVLALKHSLNDKNWDLMYASAHKMIPSFSIMGICIDFENMAKKIQEYAVAQKQSDEIKELVNQLDKVCSQACKELEEEFNRIKSMNQ